MSDLPLLVNIAVALGYALVGGLLARRVGLPTIVGYLLAGVALGPFTPGFQGTSTAIHQLAEFGVILLMFGVGLHFSFKDLWQVRDIAIPGAILQMAIATSIGYGVPRGCSARRRSASLVARLGDLDRQHRRAHARADGHRPARYAPRPGRHRLAGARGPG